MRSAALEWVARFRRYMSTERRLSPHTDSNYARDLRAFAKYCEKTQLEDWGAVDSQHVRVFAAQSHSRGLSPRSIQRRLSAIRSFYEFLITQNKDRQDEPKERSHATHNPAVDVRANGTAAFKNLTNPNEAKADLPAGTISADVVLAGTDTVAIGPADLDLKEGTNTIVYAWGSAADKNLKLAVQTLSGMHSAPGGVPAGAGGQAAAARETSEVARYAAVIGAAAAAGGLVLVSRRRAVRAR